MPIDFSKLDDSQLKVAKMVKDEAIAQGLDPNLVLPLAYQESRFRVNAVGPMTSRKEKAVGVMQLLPSTARELKVNPHKLEDNIRGGVTYFKQMLENPEIGGKDPDRAYIAYNAGPNSKYFKTNNPEHIPTESILYLKKIRAHTAPEETPETQALTSESAPPESIDQNEEFVVPDMSTESAAAEAPTDTEAATEEDNAGGFNFDADKFRKDQEEAARNKPYGFSDQSAITGGAGALAGLTLGTGQVGLKTLNDFRNLPKDLTTAVQAAKVGTSASGSPQGVKDWAVSQGYKDRGAQTYEKAHQAESGKRPGSSWKNPTTGETIKPTFRTPKPPAFEPPPVVKPSPLETAGNWGSKILQNPMVNRTLAGLGIGFSGNEAIQRARAGDVPGAALSGTSALASAASLNPAWSVPANLVASGSTGALMMLDKIRNKLNEEARNPQPAPTQAEINYANRPITSHITPRIGKRRTPEELSAIREQLTGNLLGNLNNQLQDFSKPPVAPP